MLSNSTLETNDNHVINSITNDDRKTLKTTRDKLLGEVSAMRNNKYTLLVFGKESARTFYACLEKLGSSIIAFCNNRPINQEIDFKEEENRLYRMLYPIRRDQELTELLEDFQQHTKNIVEVCNLLSSRDDTIGYSANYLRLTARNLYELLRLFERD